jgi:hypothetical protein
MGSFFFSKKPCPAGTDGVAGLGVLSELFFHQQLPEIPRRVRSLWSAWKRSLHKLFPPREEE